MRATGQAATAAPAAVSRAEFDALAARVADLERARGPRDGEDLALLEQLIVSTSGLLFGALDLQRHASVDPALAEALAGACLQTPGEIGAWLRDRKGGHDGIAVQRIGRRWKVTRSAHDVRGDLHR